MAQRKEGREPLKAAAMSLRGKGKLGEKIGSDEEGDLEARKAALPCWSEITCKPLAERSYMWASWKTRFL